MAGNNRRVDLNQDRKNVIRGYEDGSAARRLEELPSEGSQKQPQHRKGRRPKTVRAKTVSRGYVVFLAVVCLAVSALCVMYLRQKATITKQYELIAEKESEFNRLKNDNDARYNQVMGSVSLEDVKEAAENRLGMHYAGEDQIVYYDLTDGSYVRQYKDVPAN